MVVRCVVCKKEIEENYRNLIGCEFIWYFVGFELCILFCSGWVFIIVKGLEKESWLRLNIEEFEKRV